MLLALQGGLPLLLLYSLLTVELFLLLLLEKGKSAALSCLFLLFAREPPLLFFFSLLGFGSLTSSFLLLFALSIQLFLLLAMTSEFLLSLALFILLLKLTLPLEHVMVVFQRRYNVFLFVSRQFGFFRAKLSGGLLRVKLAFW